MVVVLVVVVVVIFVVVVFVVVVGVFVVFVVVVVPKERVFAKKVVLMGVLCSFECLLSFYQNKSFFIYIFWE